MAGSQVFLVSGRGASLSVFLELESEQVTRCELQHVSGGTRSLEVLIQKTDAELGPRYDLERHFSGGRQASGTITW